MVSDNKNRVDTQRPAISPEAGLEIVTASLGAGEVRGDVGITVDECEPVFGHSTLRSSSVVTGR